MTGTGGAGPAERAGTEADMRAQRGDGDGDAGRADARTGRRGARSAQDVIAAALLRHPADEEGERRAVAAFRAARDDPATGRAARPRRRDDWRPRERRRPGLPLRSALSVLLAGVTLGGVAYAAIGGGGTARDTARPDRERPPAATDGTGRTGGANGTDATEVRPVPVPDAATPAPAGSALPDGPADTRDTEARCRAYERLGERGRALDATAWRRLVDAAGGEAEVAAFCAGQQAGPVPTEAVSDANKPTSSSGPAAPAPSNGAAGGIGDGAADAAENGDPGTGGARRARAAATRGTRARERRAGARRDGRSGPPAPARSPDLGRCGGAEATAGAATPTGEAPAVARYGPRGGPYSLQRRDCVLCHTPRRHGLVASCTAMRWGHGRVAVSRRNVPFAPMQRGPLPHPVAEDHRDR